MNNNDVNKDKECGDIKIKEEEKINEISKEFNEEIKKEESESTKKIETEESLIRQVIFFIYSLFK